MKAGLPQLSTLSCSIVITALVTIVAAAIIVIEMAMITGPHIDTSRANLKINLRECCGREDKQSGSKYSQDVNAHSCLLHLSRFARPYAQSAPVKPQRPRGIRSAASGDKFPGPDVDWFQLHQELDS
jgi:hypothetical protein